MSGKAERRGQGQSSRRLAGLKRAYERREPRDGYRVLVDRLWPRGLRKGALELDEWLRDLAPSNDLRKWFAHDPERWQEFRQRYRRELSSGPARKLVDDLRDRLDRGPLTLVYGARDEEHNNAVVLKSVLDRRAKHSVRSMHRPRGA